MMALLRANGKTPGMRRLHGGDVLPCRRGCLRGFTLVELLVVVVVMAILISLAVPGLFSAMNLCRQVREQASAGQLMVAFHAYAHDSRGLVLAAYPTKKMVSGPIEVVNASGERLTGEVAQRYPWRIIPYFSGDFRGLYMDRRVIGTLVESREYTDATHSYDYALSLFPSFGMNGAWVGGSDLHGQFGSDFRKVFGRPYINRIDEPRRPTGLITFVSARSQTHEALPSLVSPEGFFRVESPWFTAATGRKWESSYDQASPLPGANSGFVSLRRTGRSVTAMFDGHARTMGWQDLNDMRHWADQATGPDWSLEASSSSK